MTLTTHFVVLAVLISITHAELSTDAWYTIKLKNGGILTWSNAKVDNTYNHAQIATHSAAPDFEQNGKYYNDAQWKLVRTEEPKYFLLVNRAQPNAVLTWAGSSPSGSWVVLFLDHVADPNYVKGGQFREDSLWKIEEEEGSTGFYILYNKRFPESGIVTWANQGVGEGKKHVQLYKTGSTAEYKHNGDYLWSFTEVDVANLATNTWYRIELKAGGILTWASGKVDNKYNHVQIVYGAGTKEFEKGAKYWHDTHWKLVKSEEGRHVVFVNRAQPNAVLTWAGKSASGKYVVLYLYHASNTDYVKEGQYRTDCLWRIDSSVEHSEYFNIYNKRFPGTGIMTWANQKVVEGKKYVQIYDTGNASQYRNDPDYLWKFTSVSDDPLA